MNYSELKVTELQKLCRDRDLQTGRVKADMIDRLETYDRKQALDELVQLTEDMGLYVDVTASESEPAPPVQTDSEWATEPDTELEDGAFVHTFPRNADLTNEQHTYYMQKTEAAAQKCGYTLRSGAFRVTTGFSDQWEYHVWVE